MLTLLRVHFHFPHLYRPTGRLFEGACGPPAVKARGEGNAGTGLALRAGPHHSPRFRPVTATPRSKGLSIGFAAQTRFPRKRRRQRRGMIGIFRQHNDTRPG